MRSATRRMLRRFGSHRGNSSVRGISRDISGSVLPMMAAGILVLAAIIGGGVDMARAYKAERRLQAACDAAALAGRRAITTNGFDTTAQAQANQYFNANFDDAEQQTTNTTFTPTSPDNGSTVVGTASTRLNMLIMKIFGFGDMSLAVTCSASMGVGNSDVMFVLDNTGSMAQEPNGTSPEEGENSKLQSLQAAMKNFYDTVAASVQGTNARIRYGFVPYSSAVRVGELIYDLDADYLADTITVPSVQYVNWSVTPIATWSSDEFTYSSTNHGNWSHHTTTQYGSESSCISAKPADTEWVDTGSPTNTYSYSVEADDGHQIKTTGIHQPQTYTDYKCRQSGGDWYVDKRTGTRTKRSSVYEERTPEPVTAHNATFSDAVLQNRTIDVSTYKTFVSTAIPTGVRNSGQNTDFDDTSTWPGCIQERQTTAASTFTFVSLEVGITPAEAFDLNIDAPPTADIGTKWAPLWPQVTYTRDEDYAYEAIDKDGTGIDEGNHDDAQMSSACPYEARLLDTLTESEFDTYADSLVATGNTYHDIGLLWGARLSSPTGLWSSNVNEEAANGGTVSRHLIFMTDGILQPSLSINSSYGVEELQERITGNGSSTTQYNNHRSRFLAICEAVKARGLRLWVIAFGTSLSADLVTCATDGYASAFQADNADELNEHFQEIANQVGELRIIQ